MTSLCMKRYTSNVTVHTHTCFQKALYSFSIATSYVILFLLVQFILDLSSYTYKLTTEYNNFITLISKKLQIYI